VQQKPASILQTRGISKTVLAKKGTALVIPEQDWAVLTLTQRLLCANYGVYAASYLICK